MNSLLGCFIWESARESVDQGREFANELIENGKAKEKFRQGIALQGGDSRVMDEPERLPAARSRVDVVAASAGFVESVECEQLGLALAILGGGREKRKRARSIMALRSNFIGASAIVWRKGRRWSRSITMTTLGSTTPSR